MKKILSFLLLVIGSSNVYAAAPAILVREVQGHAQFIINGQTVQVKPGSEIPQGAILKSDNSGSVDVSIYGDSGFRFLAGTQIVFENTDPQKIKLNLQSGNLIARFKNKVGPKATFDVETPTAVLAVRGTQFWGRVVSPEEKPVTSFAVREGVVSVKVKAGGEIITLKKGEAVDLSKNDKQPRLRSAQPAEMSAIAQSETIQI